MSKLKFQIQFLKSFLKVWDEATDDQLAELSVMYNIWLDSQKLEHLSADDLLIELMQKHEKRRNSFWSLSGATCYNF